ARYTLIDYDREMALIAVHHVRTPDPQGGIKETKQMIGVSRYITNPDLRSCEFSLAIADAFGGQGLGSRMMLSIMDFARNKGLSQIEGLVLSKNAAMLKLMHSLGFTVKPYPEDPDLRLCTKLL
ncbi:MAG: GNAT family N-acetyltransferase, partial [Oxalobacteraceae bacterium]